MVDRASQLSISWLQRFIFHITEIFSCLHNLISFIFLKYRIRYYCLLKKKKYLADNQSHLFNCWSTWKASETQQQRTRNYLSTLFGHWGSLGEETDAVCLKQANKTLTDRPFICVALHFKKYCWRKYILTCFLIKTADTLSYGSSLPWGWRMPVAGRTLWNDVEPGTRGSRSAQAPMHPIIHWLGQACPH